MHIKFSIAVCLALLMLACDQPLGPMPTQSPAPSPAPSPPEISTIQVGDSVTITLQPADFVAFDQFGDSKWVRNIRVASKDSVRAELTAVANEMNLASLFFVGTGSDCAYGPNSAYTARLTCPIPANTEVVVTIYLYPGPGVGYSSGGVPTPNPTVTFSTRRVGSL